MKFLQITAFTIVGLYLIVIIILYALQTKLIFFPGKLPKSYKFRLGETGEEVFIKTADGENINALFFRGVRDDVVLYFHGNAGDLSGWQFVGEDFVQYGYNLLIIDYRGYGKSSGSISEEGFYADSEAAYGFLIQQKNFNPQDVIIYGRSVGTGVAVHLATRVPNKGLILESPYTSLKSLADEKLPFFFPSLYLKYSFNNISKINKVKGPVVFIHGTHDTLIPSSHSELLYKTFEGQKKFILVSQGAHNDLNSFEDYHHFLKQVLPEFF
jgi:uncharacterized protein